jgi:hypothetical protein
LAIFQKAPPNSTPYSFRKKEVRASALPCEQTAGRGALFVVSKVMDLSHFGVVTEIIRHEPRASVSFFHADAQSSSDRLSIQQEWGSSWVPMAPRNALTSFMSAFEPCAAPAIKSE